MEHESTQEASRGMDTMKQSEAHTKHCMTRRTAAHKEGFLGTEYPIPAKRSLSTELSVDRKILKLNSTAAAVGGSYNAPKLQLGTGGAKAGAVLRRECLRAVPTFALCPRLQYHQTSAHFSGGIKVLTGDVVWIRAAFRLCTRDFSFIWLLDRTFRMRQNNSWQFNKYRRSIEDCKLQGIEGTIPCDAYGDSSRSETWSPSTNEFIAYRSDPDIYFAISVGKSLMARDFSSFFRLYANAPKMAGHCLASASLLIGVTLYFLRTESEKRPCRPTSKHSRCDIKRDLRLSTWLIGFGSLTYISTT
eukprot:760520-Hanusia_phi.AAC.3